MAQVSIKKESDLLKDECFESGLYVIDLKGEIFITVSDPEAKSSHHVVSLINGVVTSFSESHAYSILEPRTKLEIIV